MRKVASTVVWFWFFPKSNQTFHYTRRITPKRVTSLQCPTYFGKHGLATIRRQRGLVFLFSSNAQSCPEARELSNII